MKVVNLFVGILMCFVFVGCSTPAEVQDRSVTNAVTGTSVIELSIYTYDGNGHNIFLVPNLGHSFVGVKNLSASSITIGNYTLAAGEEITIGTFVQSAHSGVWYNIEAAYIALGTYQNVVSLSIGVEDLLKIDAISDYILATDYWSFKKNCTNFALDLWNLAAGDDAISVDGFFTTPTNLQKQIMRFSEFERNKVISTTALPSYFDGTNLVLCSY